MTWTARPRLTAFVLAFALALAPLLHATPARAQDATVHQIYEAVQAGRLKDADTMIERVLHDHPNSAKAHYVAAEVYVREGRIATARDALAQAERIDPLLSFAKPESIRALRAAVRGDQTAQSPAARSFDGVPPAVRGAAAASGFPWLGLLAGAALAIGVATWLASRRAAAASAAGQTGPMQGGFGPTSANPYTAAPSANATASPARSGLGSMLATAAAAGAGAIAGEAIARQLWHDAPPSGTAPSNEHQLGTAPLADDTPAARDAEPDFGVRDDGGWTDTGLSDSSDFGADAGGGDDWT